MAWASSSGVRMKFLGITAFALIALTSGTSTAAPIEHLSRLPGRCLRTRKAHMSLADRSAFTSMAGSMTSNIFPRKGTKL